MSAPLKVGDRVTVQNTDTDPIEIIQHRHGVIAEVLPDPSAPTGVTYLVKHPPISDLREVTTYGPFPVGRLIKGWANQR
jgi:hypothetical protein